MTKTMCSIAGCEGVTKSRGWCNKHYRRWQDHGTPHTEPSRVTHPGEQWLPAPGYEGLYEVSDQGRVWTVLRHGTPGGIIKPTTRPAGYLYVKLSKNGASKFASVHTLVATAFHGPRPSGMQCRHMDGVPGNNNAGNLRWGTASENQLDRQRHGTNHQVLKTHCPQGHPYSPENTMSHPGRPGRWCRQCSRDGCNARYAKIRAAKIAVGWEPRKYTRR